MSPTIEDLATLINRLEPDSHKHWLIAEALAYTKLHDGDYRLAPKRHAGIATECWWIKPCCSPQHRTATAVCRWCGLTDADQPYDLESGADPFVELAPAVDLYHDDRVVRRIEPIIACHTCVARGLPS